MRTDNCNNNFKIYVFFIFFLPVDDNAEREGDACRKHLYFLH